MGAPFSTAFLSGDRRADAFLNPAYRDAKARAAIARQAASQRIAPALVDALREQNRRLPASATRDRHLERLSQPGTTVIVTGQQMGLFLGPLYGFYKAASAIADARALAAETGVPCVPVFWLQTEDHDFPEIDHCQVVGANGERIRLLLPSIDRNGRTCVEQRRLGAEIEQLVSVARERLDSLPFVDETIGLLRRHYRPDASLSEAFAGLLAEVFADEGLVVINPRDPTVARLAASVHRRAISDAETISKLLLDRGAALDESGFDVQVAVRPRSPLSFFHLGEANGPRHRIEPDGDAWRCSGTDQRVSTAELRDALERTPLRFSTSALLRPLLQDTLLPTAGYVGGPGELNYFAQLAPLYEHWQLPQPMVIPRARFRVLEPRVRSTLKQLGLDAAEVERPREAVLEALGGKTVRLSPDDIAPRGRQALKDLFEQVRAESKDPDVDAALRRTEGTIDHALSRLAARYRRSVATRDRVLLERVDRVQAALFPEGEPQERVDSLPSFTARHGVRHFKDLVFQSLVPFSGDVVEIVP